MIPPPDPNNIMAATSLCDSHRYLNVFAAAQYKCVGALTICGLQTAIINDPTGD